MRFKRRLLSVVLVVVLASSTLLSPVAVCAQTTSDLYGTGSADEINIIKLIDMALNKGGMSMSPSTIKAFLDFWWSSVRADLDKCISNADSAITTTQAFANYVISALENSDHYDNLGPIMVKYVQYVCALSGKSLSDIKHLILQPGTFRQFLLSYVTDEDGNIAGTVDNKLKKYQLKTGLVNMVREAADAYIEEYEGYYLVKTHKPSDLPASAFTWKSYYDGVTGVLKKMQDNQIIFVGFSFTSPNSYYRFYDFTDYGFVLYRNTSSFIEVNVYDSNWSTSVDFRYSHCVGGTFAEVVSSSENYNEYRILFNNPFSNSVSQGWLYSLDGRTVKVWKTLDAFKNSSVGKSDIYYTNSYSNYDSSVDNSVTFTGSYYNDTSSSYSHEVIQSNIDNSSEVNESTINNITNQTINNITNNYYTDSSGNGSGSGSDNDWNLGEGIAAFIRGVAELLDFLLKLLGDLVGLLGRFLTDVLEVFKSLGVVGSGFGEFLKEVFGFLPDECISLIMSSIGAMCIVGIVKAFKK